MKPSLLVVLGVLVVSPFALVGLERLTLDLNGDFEVEAPAWEAGYGWSWDVTLRSQGSGQVLGMVRMESGEARVDATRQAQVLNTTLPDREGRPMATVLDAFRVDRVRIGSEDLYDREGASAPPPEAVHPFLCILPCASQLTHHDVDGKTWFGGDPTTDRADLRLFEFPLTRDKTWTVAAHAEGPVPLRIEAKAVAFEYVNLDGWKPMKAVRVEARLADETKDAMKAGARALAEEEDVALTLDLDLKMTYWYAPDIQNLIRFDLDGFIAGRAAGHGVAGSARLDLHADQVIKEARLTAGAERTLDEAEALARSTRAREGDATFAAPESWPFAVRADALAVDATAGSEVRFDLVAPGAGGETNESAALDPPPGATVTWTQWVFTWDGTEIETQTGPDATFRFDAPGLHGVTATVTDASGRALGSASTVIEGYTHEVHRIEGPIGSGPEAPIRLTVLSVAPGASNGTVTLESAALAKGTLQIGTTQREEVMVESDPVQIAIADLTSEIQVVAWDDEARIGELVATIEVRYDREAAANEAATDEAAAGGGVVSGDLSLRDLFAAFIP